METQEYFCECPTELDFSELSNSPGHKIYKDSSMFDLLEDLNDLETVVSSRSPNINKLPKKKKYSNLKRSASVAIMSSAGEIEPLDVNEHKFFVKLKSSSKELRNTMWAINERKQKKDKEEEVMKCKKNREAAVKTAVQAIRSVQKELAKATSFTALRGWIEEAENNNKELKQSIFHKMSDRSFVRLSVQPDFPRLVWQIIRLKSQVTVLQERLRYLTEKYKNMSSNISLSQNRRDSSTSVKDGSLSGIHLLEKSKNSLEKSRSRWKSVVARFFGSKKVKE